MPYKSEADAIDDALRLSKAMTYENAACGIDFGRGRAVRIGDPRLHGSQRPAISRSSPEPPCRQVVGSRSTNRG